MSDKQKHEELVGQLKQPGWRLKTGAHNGDDHDIRRRGRGRRSNPQQGDASGDSQQTLHFAFPPRRRFQRLMPCQIKAAAKRMTHPIPARSFGG